MKGILGFDTSCYTTSIAAVDLEGRVLGSFRALLPVEKGQRGLRQSEAVFAHVRQLPPLMARLRRDLPDFSPAAVCASSRPRDSEDSYMPVFQVGDAHARSIAAAMDIPCFESTHQRGHVRAAMVDSGLAPGPFLALHLSGGTTELLLIDGAELKLLGGAMDLNAGQLVDRAGVAMGLGFPAGPQLEELAKAGKAKALLPAAMDSSGLWCHLSGGESQVVRWIQQGGMSKADIAMEIYDFLARTIARLLEGGMRKTGVRQALAAGGVASSELFRRMAADRLLRRAPQARLYFGSPSFSGDNAVGAALIGLENYLKRGARDGGKID